MGRRATTSAVTPKGGTATVKYSRCRTCNARIKLAKRATTMECPECRHYQTVPE